MFQISVIQTVDSRTDVHFDQSDLMAQNNEIDSEPNKSDGEPDAKIKIYDRVEPSGDCKVNLGPNTRSEIAQLPSIRLIKSNKEESKEQVKKTNLGQKQCETEVKDLAPRKSEKVVYFP